MPQKELNTIQGEGVLRYIPQRPPVVMVDELAGIEGDRSYSSFTVPADNIFCRGGMLDECALVEHMAQSAALRVGYECISAGKPVPLGYIGAVQDCEFAGRVRVGETLSTSMTVVARVGEVTLAELETNVGEKKVCSLRLKIFLQHSLTEKI